jgi:competence protein ComFC
VQVVALLSKAGSLRSAVLDLLYPRLCVGCGKEGAFICSSFYRSILRIVPPLCLCCGTPQVSGILSYRCVGWLTAIDGIRSPFQFSGVMRKSVHHMKYGNLRAVADYLAEQLFGYLVSHDILADIIMLVPLHPGGLRGRKYNQSRLLSEKLDKMMNLRQYIIAWFRRNLFLLRTGLSIYEERRANVVGAFTCWNNTLVGKKVLLIDNVIIHPERLLRPALLP